MFERTSFKIRAKEKVKANMGPFLLITLVFSLLTTGIIVIPGVGFIAEGILLIAWSGLLLKTCRKQPGEKVDFSDFTDELNNWVEGILALLWMFLWTLLWTLLFIIPGLVKSFAYSQTYFILADNPRIKVSKALRMSIVMTGGYKGDLFIMSLSFFGWLILSGLTCGILFLWTMPYMSASFAEAYLYLKEQAIITGKLSEADFLQDKSADSENTKKQTPPYGNSAGSASGFTQTYPTGQAGSPGSIETETSSQLYETKGSTSEQEVSETEEKPRNPPENPGNGPIAL